MAKKCWCVFVNDSVKLVVTGSEKEAEKAKEKIRHLEYEGKYKNDLSYDDYKNRFYWHVHEVVMIKNSKEV